MNEAGFVQRESCPCLWIVDCCYNLNSRSLSMSSSSSKRSQSLATRVPWELEETNLQIKVVDMGQGKANGLLWQQIHHKNQTKFHLWIYYACLLPVNKRSVLCVDKIGDRWGAEGLTGGEHRCGRCDRLTPESRLVEPAWYEIEKGLRAV